MSDAPATVALLGGTVSGRVGAVVYSRNRHGPYSYAWSPRVDPNTTFQQRIRAALVTILPLWRAMPPPFRADWDAYAKNVGRVNRLGQLRFLTGFNRFCGALTFRGYSTIAGFIWAPTVFTLARLRPVTYTPFGVGFAIAHFDLTDPWRRQNGAGVQIYQSRAQSPAVNHFTGPFTAVTHVHGNPASPPTAIAINLIYQPTAQKPYLFFRARCIEADNRMAPPLIAKAYFPGYP